MYITINFVNPDVTIVCLYSELVFTYLIDMKEEYGEVKKNNNEEWHDEDNNERGEDPQQILQKTQVVFHLLKANPFFPGTKQTHLWTPNKQLH